MSPQAVESPWRTSTLLVALRWRIVRSRIAKLGIAAGAIVFLLAVLMTMNAGYLIQMLAQGAGTEAGATYAQVWAYALSAGGLGDIGTAALGGILAVAVFAPFTGTSTLSLFASDDLAGLRPRGAHRFWDALLINACSGIGLLQFLGLTALASAVTLDGRRAWAILIGWSVWLAMVSFTTTLGFLLEEARRRRSPTARRAVGGLLASLLAVAFLVDRDGLKSLYGLSEAFVDALRMSAGSFDWRSPLIVALLVCGSAAVAWAGVRAAGRVAYLPPPPAGGRQRESRRFGRTPGTAAWLLLARALWRTKECRKPVLAIAVVGAPVMALVDMGGSLMIALPITVPLAVALAWGVNVFAVVGQGLNWLASQPHALTRLGYAALATQASVCFLSLSFLAGVSVLFGRSDLALLPPLLAASAVATALTTAMSFLLSVTRPVRAPLSGPGDSLVPPLRALGYMGLLIAGGCLPALAVMFASSPVVPAAGGLLAAAALCALGLHRWADPAFRAKVMAATASG